MDADLSNEKLLIANRGEIAVRIIRTAARLGLHTIAVYTPVDATTPHVALASEAVPLPENLSYLDAELLVRVGIEHGATLVHPGYGFLSENADFARAVEEAGMTFLGPRSEVIHRMGLKHEARRIAVEADVAVVPGSAGVVLDVEHAVEAANEIGWPVMLKSTAGGGGMGLVVCKDEAELKARFQPTQARAQSLFKNDDVFLERFIAASRHVEVQVFGDGIGHAIHMGERECSVQRRHQKVIEESPSPFMVKHPDIREKMCKDAVRLCTAIKYSSAGTVEFIVDDESGEYFFLEMNTRLQVEHPVTEAIHPGLDIVEMMILQGITERAGKAIPSSVLDQDHYGAFPNSIWAIEARVYCENPAAGFKPCPGLLQLVRFPNASTWLRIDSWVDTGTTVTSFYDPLACKIIVTGASREQAVRRLARTLSKTQLHGPTNNIAYLQAICASPVFQEGAALTSFLNDFAYIPRGVDILSGGVETTVQDYPGRLIGLGMPRSGPMDSLAFRAANILAGNDPYTEALELTLLVPVKLSFHVQTVIALCGAPASLTINGEPRDMWNRVIVPPAGKVVVGTAKGGGNGGFRAYLAIRGGLPDIPKYLGSKSTSMGLGGYQGRALTSGDHLTLGACGAITGEAGAGPSAWTLPASLLPDYPQHWDIRCLSGPQDDPEFVTPGGIEDFYSTQWKVSSSSNRMGIRLEGPKISWARQSGGEGGSHPSNIHDNGYALGTVNMNGDTPVILTNEGPDMGGYVCLCVIASAELWKVGQLRPGCTVRFIRTSIEGASWLLARNERWIANIDSITATGMPSLATSLQDVNEVLSHFQPRTDPKLEVIPASEGRPKVVFRQAGDAAILVEYGEPLLDFALRARIHALELEIQNMDLPGIRTFAPCIRSTMIHYDPQQTSQSAVLAALIKAESSLPAALSALSFPARKVTMPIVLDDRWNREALERYMRSIRDSAVYLPSNVEYLARNNGLEGAEDALRLLVQTDWVVFGVGFYLACPFLVPVDPRCRLVSQKMNPSRTFTPRGAIGIAGLVAAIYPVESPGGYQLYGRTLPAWQTWGKGADFAPDRPWLLGAFDQIRFEQVSEEKYLEILRQFDAGRYQFKVEDIVFSMAEYTAMVDSVAEDVARFKERQARGVAEQEAQERELLHAWEEQKARDAASGGGRTEDSDADMTPAAPDSTLTCSLSARVWKIRCAPGDVVRTAADALLVLEAMKTEIDVEAGEEHVGKRVRALGRGVKEGAEVRAGDVLVVFEE